MKRYLIEVLIVVLFVVSRMPALGYDQFNTDVWKWKARTYDFSTGIFTLDFAKTLQKYHPGVTLMWVGTVAIKGYNGYQRITGVIPFVGHDVTVIFQLDRWQKFGVVFTLGITLAFLFYALRQLLTFWQAGLAIVFISFEPFYLALSRVYHLEALMSTFMLTSFIWFMYALENYDPTLGLTPIQTFKNAFSKTPKFVCPCKRLLVSGIFAGFALLTKTSAVVLLAICFLTLFWHVTSALPNYSKTGIVRLINGIGSPFMFWVAVSLAVFVVFWPAMWVIPIETILALIRGVVDIGVEEGHGQLYFSHFTQNPGWSYYLVVLIVRSSVVLLVGLVVSLVVRAKLELKTQAVYRGILLFGVVYLVAMTLPSKKLDRYLLPSMMAFSMLASMGCFYLVAYLRKSLNSFVVGWLVLGAVLGYFMWTAVWLHPNYLSYYNPIAGGLAKGMFILEPKWMFGQREIQKYFGFKMVADNLSGFLPNESLEKLIASPVLQTKLTVAFPEKYYTQIWPFIRQLGGWAVISELTPQATKTKYFVYPVWDDAAFKETRFELIPIGGIMLRGVTIYNVYQRAF